MKINNITISTSNSKLGGCIPCVNLPPIITCNPLAPCAKTGGCYACTGNLNGFTTSKDSSHALNITRKFLGILPPAPK